MSSEAAVIAVAAAIYLSDCVVLLERGQALWSRGSLSFGSNHYQVRGKVVALLNPFTPFVPALRTSPLFSGASNVKTSAALQALKPLALPSALQFVLIFLVLPWCLYRAPGWPFFISLVLAYVIALALLASIWWRFRRAGLATRPLIGLGFAWLACLPLSVNALRKAGLAFDIEVDARRAIRLIAFDEKSRACADLDGQIAEAMQELEEDDALYRRLGELKRQLTSEVAHGRL